jgi:enolase
MKYYLSPTNEIHAFELNGSQDYIIPENFTRISDAQVQEIRNQKEQDYEDSLTYQQKRVREYPAITEQLDALYHHGYDGWKQTIKTIKDKYPKS